MGRIFPDNSRAFDKGRGRSGRNVFMIDQVIESFCFSSSILKGSFEGLWNNAGFPRVFIVGTRQGDVPLRLP